MSMFCVYWVEIKDNEVVSSYQLFRSLTGALDWSQRMREEGKRFVTMSSEVDGKCTKMGVDGATDYEWTKRR